MSENPYISPQSDVKPVDDGPQQPKLRSENETALVGAIVGGGLGTVVAVLGFFPLIVLLDWLKVPGNDRTMGFLLFTLALWPVIALLLGVYMARVACRAPSTYRERMNHHAGLALGCGSLLIAMLFCYGMGLLGAADQPQRLSLALAVAAGHFVAGLVVGWVVGDSLGRFVWGPPLRETKPLN